MTSKVLAAIIALWGITAFANTSADVRIYKYLVYFETQHRLEIEPIGSQAAVIVELATLKAILTGSSDGRVQARSLKSIACNANECGGCGAKVCARD